MTEGRYVDDFRELIAELELVQIITYELRARRRDGGFEDLEVTPDLHNVADAGVDSKAIVAQSAKFVSSEPWEVQVMTRQDELQLAVRAVAVANSPELEVVVDLAAVYQKREPFEVDEATFEQFVQEVALMGVFPFLREAVHSQSVRLGAPLTLGLLRAGSIAKSAAGLANEKDEALAVDKR